MVPHEIQTYIQQKPLTVLNDVLKVFALLSFWFVFKNKFTRALNIGNKSKVRNQQTIL